MTTEKLDRVHHLAINVADIEKSVQWYQTSFFCKVIQQDQQQAILQFENLRISLLLPSREPEHVAFYRADAKLFGELRKQADGLLQTIISDPTGNIVKLVCSAEEASQYAESADEEGSS